VGAVLIADIAHIAGLVAGGAHPSPVGHAPVITTTTHKTLRGPRGAMILSTAEHANAIDKAVFPGLQGGPHNHTTAAIAVALHEAAQPEFAAYARQVVTNAQALAAALTERGYDLVSGGRLGTPSITTRGLREEHMPQIAAWMDDAISAALKDDEPAIERIAGEVRDLLAGFPMPG